MDVKAEFETVRVPQETVEIHIATLKKSGNTIDSVTVDKENFMFLIVQYMPA